LDAGRSIVNNDPSKPPLLETSQWLVKIVGSSHRGIVKMVEAAQIQRNKDSIRMLLGGLHLSKSKLGTSPPKHGFHPDGGFAQFLGRFLVLLQGLHRRFFHPRARG